MVTTFRHEIELSLSADVPRTDIHALLDRVEFYRTDSGKAWEEIIEEAEAKPRTGMLAAIAVTDFQAHLVQCYAWQMIGEESQ